MITTTEETIVADAPVHNPPILNTENCTLNTPAPAPATPVPTHNSQLTTSANLLDTLAHLLPRFVVLPRHAAETLALWIVHTYCFPFRDVSTYIGVESPEKRCGKTTLLGILSKLVHRPVVASNISPSAFFRVIEEMQPTLLIDEADTFLQANDELRGILNAGYHKPGAYVIRVANEPAERRKPQIPELNTESCRLNTLADTSRSGSGSNPIIHQSTNPTSSLATYSTWCPKFIAAIGHLPETLADRCIVIRMERKREGEECERMRDLDGADLREQCARFAMEHRDTIAKAKPEIPKTLNDRAADIWEPLFVIADIAGGDWPEKARAAAIALTTGAQESSPSGSLLFDLMYLFKFVFKKDRIFTEDLVAMLNESHIADRPWREARNGKPISEIWLSQQLKPYGVRPKTLRIEGKIRKGYDIGDLQQTFRYIPRFEIENFTAEVTASEAADASGSTAK